MPLFSSGGVVRWRMPALLWSKGTTAAVPTKRRNIFQYVPGIYVVYVRVTNGEDLDLKRSKITFFFLTITGNISQHESILSYRCVRVVGVVPRTGGCENLEVNIIP